MAPQTIRQILTRDFILGCFAQFSFIFVWHILIPTLPIYLSRLGSEEAEIGILIGSIGISSLALRPFVGRALLKIPEKVFMIAGALLFALTSIAYLFAPPFWPFLMVRVLQGVGLAFFQTASFTWIANRASESHRGQSFGYFYLAQTLSLSLAPAFGIFLIRHFGFDFLFLVCAGESVLCLFITSQLEKREVVQSEDSSGEDSFFLNRRALPPSIMSFFYYFAWGALGAFFPLYAIDHGVANPGLFFTAMALVLILGRAFGGKILDLYSRERMILYTFTLCGSSMILLAFSKNLPMFILVGMIWGVGAAFLNPTVMAYTLDRSGSAQGSAMGTYTALSDLGASLGPVIMGIIIPLTSYPIMFLCLALIGGINLGYFYFFVRKG